MDLAFIERLMQLFGQSSLAELEYGDASGRVRLGRGPGATSGGPAKADHSPPHVETEPSDPRRHEVRASFPGVFYRKAAPDQPPLVEIGDTVEEGQTLGMLEAMKLFNAVQADVAGRVLDISKTDGATVEAGAVLFVLEPLESGNNRTFAA